jgi:serine protease
MRRHLLRWICLAFLRRMRWGALLLGILACAGPSGAAEYLVQMRPSASAQRMQNVLRLAGARHLRGSYSGRFEVVAFKGLKRAQEQARLRRLKAHPDVLSVTPNFKMRSASMVPADPYYLYQWNLYDLQMEMVWDTSNADAKNVVVAVLDTGVVYENWGGYVMPADLSSSSFLPGWDFVNHDSKPIDDNGHGTHIAAILVERTDNETGAAAMAAKAKVLPVKVLDAHGRGTLEGLINGIDYARTHGAQVINMSLNFPPGTPSSPLLEQALADAYNAGIVLVGSSGNDGVPNVSLPAASNYVIAVGASNWDRQRAPYSNYGAALDVLAPGGDARDRNSDGKPDAILQVAFAPGSPTTYHHYFGIGTSQAAAHVSAAAAVLLKRSGLGTTDRPLKIRGLLQKKAKNGGNWDPETGYGVIQVYDSWALSPIPTTPLNQWQGYVTTPATEYSPGAFAAVYSHSGGLWAFLETPEEGLFGLFQAASSQDVWVFDVPGASLEDVYRSGVASFLNQKGWLPGLLSASQVNGLVQPPNGLMGLLDASGLLQGLLAAHGAPSHPVTFLWSDPTGDVVEEILDSGGLMSLLNVSGGLMSLLNVSGGLMSLLNVSGGLMSLLNVSGAPTLTLSGSGEPFGLAVGMSWQTGTLLSSGLLDPPLP